jgi:hypothetical protein
MKCPRCHNLNSDSDASCVVCHGPLSARSKAEASTSGTPEWAYLFVALCGAIPLVSLGGAIPAALGGGGAALCLGIARSSWLGAGVRMFLCLLVTVACWFAFAAMVAKIATWISKRH